MTPEQNRRYSRQIHLPAIGEAGQQTLLASRVLVIGMGGLGSPAALYLAAAGVGTLVISDFDRVEDSNLQRQIIHRAEDIGELKARSAARTLTALNPACTVVVKDWQLDGAELDAEVQAADLIVDCCDNFATRFALNRVALRCGKPLVCGAAIRTEGQLISLFPDRGPCYQCLYPGDLEQEQSCAMEGVLAPVVGVIGSWQALQAIQILTGDASVLVGRLHLFDAWGADWRCVQVPQDPDCAACGGKKPTA